MSRDWGGKKQQKKKERRALPEKSLSNEVRGGAQKENKTPTAGEEGVRGARVAQNRLSTKREAGVFECGVTTNKPYKSKMKRKGHLQINHRRGMLEGIWRGRKAISDETQHFGFSK